MPQNFTYLPNKNRNKISAVTLEAAVARIDSIHASIYGIFLSTHVYMVYLPVVFAFLCCQALFALPALYLSMVLMRVFFFIFFFIINLV